MQKIKQLTVLTANQCTAACGHCSMNSSPQRTERLSFSGIRRVLDQLVDCGSKPKVVIFAGGEPTLLKGELLDSLAYCSTLGIATRMVTNASWAITESAAARHIESFRLAGLNEINFSADDFHLPYIPFKHVANAWRASKGKGFRSVVIANCLGGATHLTPSRIMEFLQETITTIYDDDGFADVDVMPAADGTKYLLSNARLQRLGRGADIDDASLLFPEQDALDIPCPWAITSAALSAEGHLVACCGTEAHGNEFLDFGNALSDPVTDLLEIASNRLVVQAIRKFGPLFLLRFARQIDATLPTDGRFASVCEICENVIHNPQVRNALRNNIHELQPLLEEEPQ
jgi:hypothetical protein